MLYVLLFWTPSLSEEVHKHNQWSIFCIVFDVFRGVLFTAFSDVQFQAFSFQCLRAGMVSFKSFMSWASSIKHSASCIYESSESNAQSQVFSFSVLIVQLPVLTMRLFEVFNYQLLQTCSLYRVHESPSIELWKGFSLKHPRYLNLQRSAYSVQNT